jgi:hypothetical protein
MFSADTSMVSDSWKGQLMLKRRVTVVLIGLVVGTSVTVGIAAARTAGHRDFAMRPMQSITPSVPIPTSAPDWLRDVLEATGYSGGLSLVAGGASGDPFYTFLNEDGGLCLATGGGAICPNPGAALLGSSPIADFVQARGTGVGGIRVVSWRGMTKSIIASVDLVDSDGQVHTARVVNGVFDVEGPFISPVRYEARDSTGEVLWSREG